MPAKSEKQQKFMGMVHQCQKTGKCASPKVKKVAKSMKKKDAKDFASTKHKGLPVKVKKEGKETKTITTKDGKKIKVYRAFIKGKKRWVTIPEEQYVREIVRNTLQKIYEAELKGKKVVRYYIDVYNNPKRYANIDLSKLDDTNQYDLAAKHAILKSRKDKKNKTYQFITGSTPSKLTIKEVMGAKLNEKTSVIPESVEDTPLIAKIRNIVNKRQSTKIDGQLVDLFTAQHVIYVWDKVNDTAKERLSKLKIKPLVSVVWKLVK